MPAHSPVATVTDSTWHNLTTWLTYCLVAIVLILAWNYSSLNFIHAESGIGYWLGIAGATLMGLLFLYPARKRAKSFRNLGPVKYWFKLHMIFGIVGPMLIIFHSNFNLGSLNSRIALFSTLIVAGSGIIGRYLYAKIHYGLYGHSASLVSLRADVNGFRDSESGVAKLIPNISMEMNEWEDEQLAKLDGFFAAFARAMTAGVIARMRYRRIKKDAKRLIHEAAASSGIVADHENRLIRNTNDYLFRRLTLMRKFIQYRAFERLFSLWHIVHYPLFFILVVATIVHILAVHMY